MAKEKLKLLVTVRAQGLSTLGEVRCDVGYGFCVLSQVRLVCAAAVPYKIYRDKGPQKCSEGWSTCPMRKV